MSLKSYGYRLINSGIISEITADISGETARLIGAQGRITGGLLQLRFPHITAEMGTIRIGSRPSHRKITSPALRERVAGASRRPGEGLSAGDTLTLPRLPARVPPSPAIAREGLF